MMSSTRITNNIVSKLKGIGINSEYNGEPSHTAEMIRIIVEEVLKEITRNGEVHTVVNTTGVASQPGTPETQSGTGYGRPGSIK